MFCGQENESSIKAAPGACVEYWVAFQPETRASGHPGK